MNLVIMIAPPKSQGDERPLPSLEAVLAALHSRGIECELSSDPNEKAARIQLNYGRGLVLVAVKSGSATCAMVDIDASEEVDARRDLGRRIAHALEGFGWGVIDWFELPKEAPAEGAIER
jgi:hypothetical protein